MTQVAPFNHMAEWNLLDVVNSVILKFPVVVLRFYKHSNVKFNYNNYYLLIIIITIIIIIIIIIVITERHNNYCSAGVMEL